MHACCRCACASEVLSHLAPAAVDEARSAVWGRGNLELGPAAAVHVVAGQFLIQVALWRRLYLEQLQRASIAVPRPLSTMLRHRLPSSR
jgi:hypothetical protein